MAKAAYTFCMLEQFHRHLRRRNIFARVSARWADPRAQLLDGHAWANAKGPALNALGLPEQPGELLVGSPAPASADRSPADSGRRQIELEGSGLEWAHAHIRTYKV